jgi:hypothetical protein
MWVYRVCLYVETDVSAHSQMVGRKHLGSPSLIRSHIEKVSGNICLLRFEPNLSCEIFLEHSLITIENSFHGAYEIRVALVIKSSTRGFILTPFE